MKNNRRGLLVKHLSGGELDQATADAQKADETRLIRRLCYVKNLYHGDTREEAGDRVGISRSTTRRWARAWNEDGVEGLRPGLVESLLNDALDPNAHRISLLDEVQHEQFDADLA